MQLLYPKKRRKKKKAGTGPTIVLISSTEDLFLKLSLAPYGLGRSKQPDFPTHTPQSCQDDFCCSISHVIALFKETIVKRMAIAKIVLRTPAVRLACCCGRVRNLPLIQLFRHRFAYIRTLCLADGPDEEQLQGGKCLISQKKLTAKI